MSLPLVFETVFSTCDRNIEKPSIVTVKLIVD